MAVPPSPEKRTPLRFRRWVDRSLERFLAIEAASGILLLVAVAVALIWANSPWAESYTRFWHTPISIWFGAFTFERSLGWIVNDGLMVIFFFVVGMEIRREVRQGELSEWRRAALPAAAALGGMLVPAAVYFALAGASVTRSGWSVPMATDLAFAVGILTLLGKRVPAALRVLLLALVVITNLYAIVVIAFFYPSGIVWAGFAVAAAGLAGSLAFQRFGVRANMPYIAAAIVVWTGIHIADVHPIFAGMLVGLATPVGTWLGSEGTLRVVHGGLERQPRIKPSSPFSTERLSRILHRVNVARPEILSPVKSLIAALHPWVAFGIMPIFALANAGVSLSGGGEFDSASWNVAFGVALGLIAGKPLGVLLASWLTLRLRIGTLPAGLTMRHLAVLGVVAGIGFTMSLFIAPLAFADGRLLTAGKLGVLAASGFAAILGLVLGRTLLSPLQVAGAAATADEAEASTTM